MIIIKLSYSLIYAKPSSGGYDKEERAAKAYDLAALKYWGPTTHINFPVSNFGPVLPKFPLILFSQVK